MCGTFICNVKATHHRVAQLRLQLRHPLPQLHDLRGGALAEVVARGPGVRQLGARLPLEAGVEHLRLVGALALGVQALLKLGDLP